MATIRLCSVAGCDKPHKAHGWCGPHYKRWRNHGDPEAGGTPKGAAAQFLREIALAYDGDDCLIWPFSCNESGYAQIGSFDGRKMVKVCRYVCEVEHGPPPTPTHDAAHSCGRGHEGCISRRHLSWKTRRENMADKLIHGTHNRGEQSPTAKLTESDVHLIRTLRGTVDQKDLAERFGVSQTAISRIQLGKIWAWLSPAPAKC